MDHRSKILEIGAGSGKATELFVNKGLNITCIEPGENLALEGEKKFKNTGQVQYIVNRFEDWIEVPEYFDLVFSAQAFHWVPKPIGFEKSYNTLKPGKYLGLFWNFYYSTGENVELELHKLFEEFPLAYIDTKESLEKRIQKNIREIQDCQYFTNIEVLQYPWSQVSNTEEYLGFIRTGNGYLTLTEDERRLAEERLTAIIEDNGGSILRSYQCTLFLAQKK